MRSRRLIDHWQQIADREAGEVRILIASLWAFVARLLGAAGWRRALGRVGRLSLVGIRLLERTRVGRRTIRATGGYHDGPGVSLAAQVTRREAGATSAPAPMTQD
jgi:hypothetical protein